MAKRQGRTAKRSKDTQHDASEKAKGQETPELRSTVHKGSPIMRVPDDVLRLIFIHGMEQSPYNERTKFSRCVGSVCRSWTAISNDTPELWTLIYITLDRSPFLVALQSTLTRSRSRKLDIVISQVCPPSHGSWAESNASVWLESEYVASVPLYEHMSRWRSITIDCFNVDVILETIDCCEQSADALEDMALAWFGGDPRACEVFFDHDFIAPRLRRLCILDIPCCIEPEHFPALEELTVNTSSSPDPSCCRSFMQVLEPLTKLRRVEMTNTGLCVGEPIDDDRLSLATLEELGIEDISVALHALFREFEAPLLKTLRIYGLKPEGLHEHDPIIIQDYFPSLRNLRLNAMSEEMDLYDISSIFGFFECVHILVAHKRLDAFIKSFTESKPKLGWCFPKLISLEINTRDSVSAGLLRQAVEARRGASLAHSEDPEIKSPVAFEELTVHTSAEISEEDRQWFDRNLSAFTWSLDVDVSRYYDPYIKIRCATT
ncbi:hypothetical protein AcW1_008664 [Taiwanofungus camphoratus]|nr:hypothetical protein AcV7_003852 [Antrodia cinnamomea]KAI0948927.1 hypothetical protein AcW1_008664 [Antrodia cinnamomea]